MLQDGMWDKAKSRICVRGDLQKEPNMEDLWSAASSKRLIRLMLAGAAKCGVTVKQLDYIGAFLQATVRSDIYYF